MSDDGPVLSQICARVPGHVLRVCLVGSSAYGLDHEDSDRDLLGVYAAPNDVVLGLDGASATSNTVTSTDPDWAMHEVGKLFALALQGNPTILEVLSAPRLADVTGGEDGLLSTGLRACLSTRHVRDAYIGYATGQAKRIEQSRKTVGPSKDARTRKHARHCFRLMIQAEALLTTGELLIDVSDRRDEIFSFGDLAVTDQDRFLAIFEKTRDRIEAVDSVLPDCADRAAVNDALLSIRTGQ